MRDGGSLHVQAASPSSRRYTKQILEVSLSHSNLSRLRFCAGFGGGRSTNYVPEHPRGLRPVRAPEPQSNKLNRMMHHSVEMPSRQVIFLPSA